jgi:hypothetical protein
MSAESENFRELRRLLAVKRYEQPPPGYFNGFNRQVIARIEAGERGGGDSLLEVLFGQGSWLLRLWSSFGTKPILAGAFGITVCSVLIAGVAYSDRSDSGSVPTLAPPSREQAGLAPMGHVAYGLLQPASATALSGTGGVLSPQEHTSLFQDVEHPRPELMMDAVTPGN